MENQLSPKKTENDVDTEKIRQARDAQKRAENIAKDFPDNKTVATDGKKTLSGWGDIPEGFDRVPPKEVKTYSDQMDHDLPAAGWLDKHRDPDGFKGRWQASHAEKQLSLLEPNEPIGVSKPMCSNCENFFQKRASDLGEQQYVADTDVTRVFNPDGRIIKIPH